MTGPRLSRFAIGAALAVCAAVAGSALIGGAAVADSPLVVGIDTPQQTVNYGSYWMVTASNSSSSCIVNSVKVTDPATGTTFAQPAVSYSGGYVFGSYSSAPLAVGTHALSVQATGGCWTGSGADATFAAYIGTATATVIVKAAPVTLDFRIAADPNQAKNATVTVQAHGDFVDQLTPAIYRAPTDPVFPAGTWKIEVQDNAKKVVFTKSVDQPAGSVSYLSEYWTDVPKGEQFTGTASDTTTGSGPSTIDVPGSVSTTFTSAGSTSPSGSTVVIDPQPSAAPLPSGSVALPAAAVIGGVILGIVAIAVLIASLMMGVRRRKTGTPRDPDDATVADAPLTAGSLT